MKAFPIEKFLTGVMIFFFACLSWGQDITAGHGANETSQKCEKLCGTWASSQCTDPGAGYEGCVKNYKDRCMNTNNCSTKVDKADRDSDKRACDSAFEKYSEASIKSNAACAAFDSSSSSGKTCKEKSAACNKKIKSLANPLGTQTGEDPSDDESGYGALKQIAMTSIYQQMGIAANSNNLAAQGGVCVKSIDRKARAQEKKEKDRERKDLQEKIKQQKEKIIEYKADLDKERNENSEKTAELEAENKKEILAKDKSISDETSKVSKEIVDIGKRLRGISKQITDQMQALARVNFKHQTEMLALSDENTNTKCKQTFESLKAAIVSSKMSTMNLRGSAEEQQQYAALAALANQYKAQGIKGSGELKNMLIAARKQCYETANTSRNKAKLENTQTVESIQNQITELKSQMSDEKNGITTAQKSIETLKSQVDKEKQQAEAEKLTKLDNLSKKLSNKISNTEEKTKNANDKIKELNAEINKLVLVENFEVEDAYSEAEEAIEKGNSTRESALEACDCENIDNRICSQLRTSFYDGKTIKVNPKDKTSK